MKNLSYRLGAWGMPCEVWLAVKRDTDKRVYRTVYDIAAWINEKEELKQQIWGY